MKRLFGGRIDAADKASGTGMEIDTVSKYAINILLNFKPEESPIRPPAAEILRQRMAGGNPGGTCLPLGIPLDVLVTELVKIVQSPRLTIILYESDNTHRQIYTDGRSLPKENAQPAWLGYSVGHWDGETLVVETTGFNDKTALDGIGHPHSEALRVLERYRRRDFGHMDVEMTFDDPEMYTKPFTIKVAFELQPDSDIFEYFCNENEKDRSHLAQ